MSNMQNATTTAFVIADLRKKLQGDIERKRAELEELLAQDAEYQTAERVLLSIGATAIAPEAKSPAQADDKAKDDDAPSTVPDMIIAVIQEAYAESHRGVTGGEIFATIQRRWKPDAKSDGVRPVIWRLEKGGRIKKKGKFYYPKSDVEAEAAPQTTQNGVFD